VLAIRRYEEADHDEVWVLHNRTLAESGAHAGSGPWDDDLHEIATIYLAAGGEFLVGVLDGWLVAMGALRRTAPDRAEIKRLRVDPAFQRRGFGAAILSALERRAADLGCLTLYLDTTTIQVAAQRLYLAHGYREVGRSVVGGFDTILYEKQLAHTPT
jgi:ribosomal protein S18 acetylase RimI-like enzyme